MLKYMRDVCKKSFFLEHHMQPMTIELSEGSYRYTSLKIRELVQWK